MLNGIEAVPQAFEITANMGKYQAINPSAGRDAAAIGRPTRATAQAIRFV